MLLLAAVIAPALAQIQPAPPAPEGGQTRWPVWQQPANTLKEVFEKIRGCWKPPAPWQASPMDLTVRFSFKRDGEILGKPRITYELPTATDSDRLAYRIAVMEALQRCSPMPFTDKLAGAIAGYPLVIHFYGPEKRA